MVGGGGGGWLLWCSHDFSSNFAPNKTASLAIIIQLSMKFQIDFICILPFRLNLSVTR